MAKHGATNGLNDDIAPLMRCTLTILFNLLGPQHPNSQLVTRNDISVLQALGHTEAQIAESLHLSHARNIAQPRFPA